MTTTMQRRVRRFCLSILVALCMALPLAVSAQDSGSSVPAMEGSGRVVAVTAGAYHSCALQADGVALCWGNNSNGQLNVPASTRFTALHAPNGGYYTCGLRVDGGVQCWGSNSHGQVNAPSGSFVDLAPGNFHVCGVRTDGSMVCWGMDDNGVVSTVPAGPFVGVSSGYGHSCGMKADGSVDCWGFGGVGQTTDQVGPYLSISAGLYTSCGVKADTSLACWGTPVGTLPVGSFRSVSVGAIIACGLRPDASAVCWGSNPNGLINPPAGSFASISAGYRHACGLKSDGTVQCWGDNAFGQTTVPADLGQVGFGQLAAGSAHACDLKRDGTIACWGDNSNGQTNAPAGQFAQVVAGDAQSCAIREDGRIVCWGFNSATINTFLPYVDTTAWRHMSLSPNRKLCALGITSASNPDWCIQAGSAIYDTPFGLRNVTHDRPTAGSPNLNRCGVRFDGTGSCTSGFDSAHQGDFGGSWQRLESGLNHQCGLKTDGSIECWGTALVDGQLDHAPAGTEKFRSLSTGYNHACAIRDNGQLACWGSNVSGQTDAPAGRYVQVAAGNTFTCAIRSDGQRVCWGASPGNPASLSSVPDGWVGGSYSTQIAISGPLAPTGPVFVLMSGALPPGLDLSSTGLLSGTPTTAGTYAFTVDAEGTGGFAASRAYSVTIATDTVPPLVAYELTPPTPSGNNGWYVGNIGIDWTISDAQSGIDAARSEGCADTTLSTDSVGQVFSCSAYDNAGNNTLRSTPEIKRDATPPSITAAATTAPNANGWYTGDVTIHYTCSDATSGVVSCPADQVLTASGSSTVATIYDNAGNSATSNAVTVLIDKTAPSVGYAFNPPSPDGSNGWYRASVDIDWTIGDAQSGIASSNGCVDGTLSSDTAGASWTCTAINGAGLQNEVTTATIKRDATAPTIIAAPGSAPNGNGWYNANVSVAFTCSDAMSGVASCPAAQVLGSEGAAVGSTAQTIQDNAGNSSAASNVVTVRIDKTAPVVAAAASSAPDGNNGWYRSNVVVVFTCNDALSGVASCPASQTLSADGNPVSSTAQMIQDNAGNGSAASNVVTVKIDKTAPTLAPTTPSPLLRGQSYVASANASDALSGLASSSCGALDTSTLGSKSTTCTATDNAGNVNTVTLNYTVSTTCANDGYKGTQLSWCQNICENGLTGQALDTWIHRWVNKYRDLPYCRINPPQPE